MNDFDQDSYEKDLMIDLVKFGITMEIKDASTASPADFVGRLRSSEGVEMLKLDGPEGDPTKARCKIKFEGAADGWEGSAQLDLHFIKTPRGWRLGDRSCLSFNPQRCLRGHLGGDAVCGPLGFGGATNLVGVGHSGSQAFATCLELAKAVVEIVQAELEDALPEGSFEWAELWLKAAEVCRDVHVENATAVVASIQHAALEGAVKVVRDAYRAEAKTESNVPSVRWIVNGSGPDYKLYAKRSDIVRLELACHNRDAVVSLTDRPNKECSPDWARELLEHFALCAEPKIDLLHQHLNQTLASFWSTADFLIDLGPLIDLARGEKRARGPAPSPSSVAAGKSALEMLLAVGSFDAQGISARHAVRRTLDDLKREGVLARKGARAVYCLRPEYARSAEAVSQAKSNLR